MFGCFIFGLVCLRGGGGGGFWKTRAGEERGHFLWTNGTQESVNMKYVGGIFKACRCG